MISTGTFALLGAVLGLAGSPSGRTHGRVSSAPSPVVRPESWRPISIAGSPIWRGGQVAVWTGAEMIVWGGYVESASGTALSNAGARYDPASDSWSPISNAGVPSGADAATAVWTGTEMIVWGGIGIADVPFTKFNSGARYDPAHDSWRPMATPAFLDGRYWHSAVWTGTEMIVWGGEGSQSRLLADGGAYDPVTDTWTPLSPAPLGGRRSHAAVWTGTEMFVWGGVVGYGTDSAGVTSLGLRYDPLRDAWSQISQSGRPAGTISPRAVWTGSRVIVISPPDCLALPVDGGSGDASSYDPLSDRWEPLAPHAWPGCINCGPRAFWTGRAVVLFEGKIQYFPDHDAWFPLAGRGLPVRLCGGDAVWTGTQMIVWGPGTQSSGIWTPSSP